jgi:hypothetical protein
MGNSSMKRRVGSLPLPAVAVAVLLAAAAAGGSAWAKGRRSVGPGPVLWIVADRITGFVPFTVSLYGKITGAAPNQVELCRIPVRPLGETMPGGAEGRGAGMGGREPIPSPGPPRPESGAVGPACESGSLSRTAEGFDYAHDLRFDSPGTYQVRLQMVDDQGKRTLSNPVQVNAY